jgi:hypothetical protein
LAPLGKFVVTGVMALGVTCSGLLAAGCGTPPPAAAPAVLAVTATPAVTAAITIDPDVGETFAPAPAGARPALTAQQAWARYTKVDTSYRHSAMPLNVTARLGLLTLPDGPAGPGGSEAYTVRNELVYGYNWHSCPASRNPRVEQLPPSPCIEWIFLNADTGRQIDQTWQQ